MHGEEYPMHGEAHTVHSEEHSMHDEAHTAHEGHTRHDEEHAYHHHHHFDESHDAAKSKALLVYMLQHNESHTAELEKAAQRLADEGKEQAAQLMKQAAEEYKKGNACLKLAVDMLPG